MTNHTTTCIILAGGLGTRLRAAVPSLPKCLAPIGNRSFLEIQLEMLAQNGITDFVLSLGYGADSVIAAIEPLQAHFNIRYVIEMKQLGTGGAIRFAFEEADLEQAIVANGDTYLNGDITPLLAPLDLADGERLRIATIEVLDRARFGGILLSNHLVSGFSEKGEQGPGLINAGIYHVHRSALQGHTYPEAFSLEADVMPVLISESSLSAMKVCGSFIDIGVPDDYYRFCQSHG